MVVCDKSSFLPWTSRGALLPNQPSPPPFCFLLSSSFPSLPLLSRAALLLLLVVVVAARARGVANTARINATRPGWITTTINFIERTISYVAIEPRRERERERENFLDTCKFEAHEEADFISERRALSREEVVESWKIGCLVWKEYNWFQ